MKARFHLATLALLLGAAASFHCSDDNADLLAPYAGSRPFHWLRVTKNSTPDLQWLGGRIAAAGVNKGRKAALDQSLIWLRTSDANSIGSWITFGQNTDTARILQYGGTPATALTDSAEYTFWLADKAAFAAGLDSSHRDANNFIDTTFVMSVLVKGKIGGEKNALGKEIVNITIQRNETMLEDSYTLSWTPADLPFRQIAVRTNSLGGFTDLIWHIVTPDSLADNIYPPLKIGQAPLGSEEAVAWPETGFVKNKVQILWMTNSKWKVNNFSPSATGYAWLRLYPFE
ncbi:MAG TPA: hypothetical protein PKI62_05610 [bacterium]|nr:hypothetical protein [bacterium]HPR88853.1 hypothetical protein [bacterium]